MLIARSLLQARQIDLPDFLRRQAGVGIGEVLQAVQQQVRVGPEQRGEWRDLLIQCRLRGLRS